MGQNENKIVRVAGRLYTTTTSLSSVFFVQLSPLVMDARLLQVSDAWLEFRFVKAKARAWLGNLSPASPSVTPGGANLALAYSPNLLTSAPINVLETMNLQNVQIGNGTVGCAYPHLSLSRAALTAPGPVKWYRRGTTYDDTLEVQGSFFMSSSDNWSARPLSVLIEYEVEFRTPADTALTAAAVSSDPDPALMARQIQELQTVLGVANRMVVKRPPALGTQSSPLGETKDGYIEVNEPSVTAVHGQVPKEPQMRKDAGGRFLGNWASVPSTPLSARPRV